MKKTRGLLAAGAALTALTLIFPKIGLLEWFTLIPTIAALYRFTEQPCKLWSAYRLGFFTVFVYYFVLYHWFIYLYPLDFVGLDQGASLAVVIAGWLGLTLLQAIPGGLVFLGFAALCRTETVKRLPILKPFLLAALWTIFEWSSTIGWTGVPWGRLCLGQTELLTNLQSASLLGSYFVSFLIVAVNALLAAALLDVPKRKLCVAIAAGLFLSNAAFGMIKMHLSDIDKSTDDTLTVAILQGNVNSHDKWDSDSVYNTLEIYESMTKQAAQDGAELIVMPETALPYDLSRNSVLVGWLEDLSIETQTTLVVGALWTDEEEQEYNSLFLISPESGFDGENRYDKRHLVPFGEYVPLRALISTLIPPLANLSALDDDLTAGQDAALFETEWGAIGSLICFDSIYETLAIDSVRDGACLMLISSNDSWFYDSAAVRQHLAQAQLRAIETGRTYVRAANTGISDIILPNGTSSAQIGALQAGYEVREVSRSQDQTLYTRIGNLFVLICAAALLALPIRELAHLCKRRKT